MILNLASIKTYCTKVARRRNGSALLVVLSFVLLLSIVTLAFLSRALLEKKVSDSSANQTRTDLFAAGAVNSIISDFQAEIGAASPTTTAPLTTSAPSSLTIFNPVYVSRSVTVNGTSATVAVPLTMVPSRNWTTSGTQATIPFPNPLPNLIKRSATGIPFYPTTDSADYPNTKNYPPTESTLSTDPNDATSMPSLNGRSYSAQRWNQPLLLPKANPNTTDPTPVTGSNGFTVPDWILVCRDGSDATGSWSNTLCATPPGVVAPSATKNPVVGRYAYTVYDEGGLLDMNVAGFPLNSNSANATPPPGYSIKSTLANADLRQLILPDGNSDLRPTSTGSSAQLLSNAAINALIGWRNYATLGTTGVIPAYNFSTSTSAFPALNFQNYFLNLQASSSGFLQTGNGQLSSNTSGQSDRQFTSRQQLIDLLVNDIGSVTNTAANCQNALQFMGTFSRDINAPSYQPDVNRPRMAQGSAADPAASGSNAAFADDLNSASFDSSTNGFINPSFLTSLVQRTFTRNDGSTANVGDPLVKRRFNLMRLAWLTYQGPSALRSGLNNPSPSPTGADYDLWQLENTYGISQAFLAQGTTANIQKYFGLNWTTDNNDNNRNKWFYNVHNGGSGLGKGVILEIGVGSGSNGHGVAQCNKPHDPDFFELLKGAILAGSKGKSLTYLKPATNAQNNGNESHPWNYQNTIDTSVDLQIIQIGANIIAQFQPCNYAPEIAYDDGYGDYTDPQSSGGTTTMECRGVENLPYFYRVRYGALCIRNPNPIYADSITESNASSKLKDTGVGLAMMIPEIWNPHDVNTDYRYTQSSGGLGPTQFRLLADSTDPAHIQSSGTGGYSLLSSSGFDNYSNNPNNVDSTSAVAPPTFLAAPGGTQITYTGSPTAVSPATATITFTIPRGATGQQLFREPTLLAMAGQPFGSNLSLQKPTAGLYAQLANSAGLAFGGPTNGSGFLSDVAAAAPWSNQFSANPLNLPTPPPQASTYYVGVPIGLYPIEFPYNGVVCVSTTQDFDFNGTTNGYLTFRMQYLDQNGKWETYDEKYVCPNMTGGSQYTNAKPPTMLASNSGIYDSGVGWDGQSGSWVSYADPRTARFGTPGTNQNSYGNGYYCPSFLFLDSSIGSQTSMTLTSDRPDNNPGFDTWINHGSTTEFYYNIAPGWKASNFTNPGQQNFPWGPYSQNAATTTTAFTSGNTRYYGDASQVQVNAQNLCYADPDGVVRRAMGGYQPSLNPQLTPSGSVSPVTGIPTAATYSNSGYAPPYSVGLQNQSRPYILHRPFRSVAELGYAFSDTPWKNLDFMNPESGDSALLDVFCVGDTDNPNGLVAGKVNLNTQQPPVLWAVLAGAYKDDLNSGKNNIGTNYSSVSANPTQGFPGTANPYEAADIAARLIKRTGYNANGYPSSILTNPRDLVGKWVNPNKAATNGQSSMQFFDGQPKAATLNYDGFSNDLSLYDPANASSIGADQDQYVAYIQRFREAAIRALSAVGQTRVWDLMIDVVAQTGRFPTTAQNASNFLVEGERRYWVHVAIDRYTGQVLDQQIEEVKQ